MAVLPLPAPPKPIVIEPAPQRQTTYRIHRGSVYPKTETVYSPPQVVYPPSRSSSTLNALLIGGLVFWLITHPQQVRELTQAVAPPPSPPTQPLARAAQRG